MIGRPKNVKRVSISDSDLDSDVRAFKKYLQILTSALKHAEEEEELDLVEKTVDYWKRKAEEYLRSLKNIIRLSKDLIIKLEEDQTKTFFNNNHNHNLSPTTDLDIPLILSVPSSPNSKASPEVTPRGEESAAKSSSMERRRNTKSKFWRSNTQGENITKAKVKSPKGFRKGASDNLEPEHPGTPNRLSMKKKADLMRQRNSSYFNESCISEMLRNNRKFTLNFPKNYGEDEYSPIFEPDQNVLGYFIESETELFQPESYQIIDIPDYYSLHFENEKHFIWAGNQPGSDEYFLVTVLENPTDNIYLGLEHSKKGFELFEIQEAQLTTNIKPHMIKLEKFLKKKFFPARFTRMHRIPATVNDIAEIEFRNRQIITEMKIAIVYAKDQSSPLDMFLNNEISTSYEKFLFDLGITGRNRSRWRDIKVSWYIATQMNEEQHRRLIGNCACILFFHDSPNPFSIKNIDQMGVIPQIYIVVKPENGKYRIGFFNRSSLKSFGPQLPKNLLFDSVQLMNYLLVKVHNGYMTLRQCPPLNRLYETPRQTDINTIVQKYIEKPVKTLRGSSLRKSTSL